VKFFALDCHIGIRDLMDTFAELGHDLHVESISNHSHLMEWTKSTKYVMNSNTWTLLNDVWIDTFYRVHKNDLKQYDGFVSFYPPSFSMLYERFDKPIITHIPIRFDTPFENNPHMFNKYVNHLRRTIDSGQLLATTNNLYDKLRCEDLIGRNFELIPSICKYTNTVHKKSKCMFLKHGRSKIFPDLDNLISIQNYSWEEYYSYSGIVHIPYHNTIMSLFEQYTANVPLLFPSKEFLLKLWKRYPDEVLQETSWRKIKGLPLGAHLHKTKIPDINDYNERSIRHLIENSDWNDEQWMPEIIKFDSWENLADLVNSDFTDVSEKMKTFNKKRQARIYDKWDSIFTKI